MQNSLPSSSATPASGMPFPAITTLNQSNGAAFVAPVYVIQQPVIPQPIYLQPHQVMQPNHMQPYVAYVVQMPYVGGVTTLTPPTAPIPVQLPLKQSSSAAPSSPAGRNVAASPNTIPPSGGSAPLQDGRDSPTADEGEESGKTFGISLPAMATMDHPPIHTFDPSQPKPTSLENSLLSASETPCRHYMEGKCNRRKCRFSHEASLPRAMPPVVLHGASHGPIGRPSASPSVSANARLFSDLCDTPN